MATRSALSMFLFFLLAAPLACGGSKDKDPNTASTDISSASPPDESKSSEGAGSGANKPKTSGGSAEDESKSKASMCTGSDLDLNAALIQVACEVPNDKSAQLRDLKNALELKVVASPSKVAPGAHADVVVTYRNKSKKPIYLDFMLNPTPRFAIEAYDAKGNKRVDMPAGNSPPPPKDATEKMPAQETTGRVSIAPGGAAHMNIGWDAVRTKWAPEKYKGTPVEMGYPRAPNGPLANGKYQLHLVTPLINVAEGPERELSAPKLEIEVAR